MGIVDRIQESAARSAAARQANTRPSGGARGRRGAGQRPGRPGKVSAPPMDRQERYFGYALAGVLAVVFVVLWAPHIGQPHFGEVVTKAAKGVKAKTTKVSPSAELSFGLVLSALVGWSAVLKKRWLMAGVVFYLGVLGPGIAAVGTTVGLSRNYRYLGFLLMAAGAWLLFRNAKLQADAQRVANAAAAKAAKAKPHRGATARSSGASAGRTGATARPARTVAGGRGTGASRTAASRTSPSAGRTSASRKSKEAPTDSAGRPIPAPSKRYTPPQSPSKGDRKERRERRESVRAGGAKAGANSTAKAGANSTAKAGSISTSKAGTNGTANRSAPPTV